MSEMEGSDCTRPRARAVPSEGDFGIPLGGCLAIHWGSSAEVARAKFPLGLGLVLPVGLPVGLKADGVNGRKGGDRSSRPSLAGDPLYSFLRFFFLCKLGCCKFISGGGKKEGHGAPG